MIKKYAQIHGHESHDGGFLTSLTMSSGGTIKTALWRDKKVDLKTNKIKFLSDFLYKKS